MSTILHDLFVPGIPILEKILRPIGVYAFLVIGLRLAGKRSMASLNSFDLVVLLSLSNTVQNAIIGDDTSLSGGLIGATALMATNYLVVRFFFRHRRLDRLIEGKPSRLIVDGVIQRQNLDAELITRAELEVAAHKQGFRSLSEIDSCELEPGGSLVFFERKPTVDDTRYGDVHDRLDRIVAMLSDLSARLPPVEDAGRAKDLPT